ncbi:ACP S-malonyltransferase [Aspergillus clavatus NRRL 1]|uniref:[acyl-carrier-protein] S-malonyltransferase n=1 Tax=Aspergillus clavatus (strain ATCC 1007 / CBS 513.65 / DSM 816 / NCTC 3887 / NRRL 1 / QM 1276 / 107) TaxID=344612 RepID=A1CGP1_ASPCL|nr:malonyl CoA-acyl carrier protein transacylase, putative [Aspergillus clavatus NRRL 1]EAW10046.1 malonyl CoA-acyl carrier protein transacylase, putative [Aspergillus clavatus NRRL 1]
MASSWIDKFPITSRLFLNEMNDILGFNLSHIISNGPNSELNKTENSQPAIMATSVLILRILEREFGFDTKSRVNVTLGHSLGEFSALVAGGYLTFKDALKLVRRRAEIMAECTRQASKQSGEDYGMVALVCEPDHLESLLSTIFEFTSHTSSSFNDDLSFGSPPIQQVAVGNVNSKNQIVLSGSMSKISTLLIQIRQFGGHDPRAVRLKSESPFHNPILAPAAGYMGQELDNVQIKFPAHMPCISNVSGRPFKSAEDLKGLLSRQCVETVRWWESIRYLDQERGVKRWIGIGPGKVGRNLVGKEVGRINGKGGGVWALCDPRELENIMTALGRTENEAFHG